MQYQQYNIQPRKLKVLIQLSGLVRYDDITVKYLSTKWLHWRCVIDNLDSITSLPNQRVMLNLFRGIGEGGALHIKLWIENATQTNDLDIGGVMSTQET